MLDSTLELYESNKQNISDKKKYQNKLRDTNINYLKEQRKNREIERDYRESEARYKKLTNATFEGIVIHENGRILDSNKVINKLLGYENDEINGTYLHNYICPQAKEKANVFINQYESAKIEITLIHKDLSCIDTEMFSKPFIYKSRTVKVIAVRDITERKKTEQELRRRLQTEIELSICSQILLTGNENSFTETLQHLLKASGASRAYFYENTLKKMYFSAFFTPKNQFSMTYLLLFPANNSK